MKYDFVGKSKKNSSHHAEHKNKTHF